MSLNLATKKELDAQAEAIASKDKLTDAETLLLAILATLQGIDYKLYKAAKDKGTF